MSDQRHHFISYSTADALEFANKLHNALEGGYPKLSAWLDKQDLIPTRKWDTQIFEAIRDCKSLLFVMTVDSVADNSGCYDEWSLALKYKKPVVPLLLRKCDAPFRLQSRQYVDFTGDFESGIAKLRKHLEWLESPEGELQRLKDQLADAERDLRRSVDTIDTMRIQDDITELKKTIARQEEIVRDPNKAEERAQESIERGLERERQPEKPISGTHTSKFINPPPGIAPDYFQDRHVETKQVADFLRHNSQRMITVVGRGGVGKTAMVCRLLKGLESGKLPDDLPTMPIDGIVYLSEAGTRKANVANLFSDLGKLLPKETAAELDGVYKNPQATTASKVQKLLEAFPTGRYVVLLDNFEDVLDEQRKVKDAELDEALKTFLNAPQHGIKVIITTRVVPRELLLTRPERQRLPALELDSGLGSPYAENVLREMDNDGRLGLKHADDTVLKNACERVMGYPRALEALVAVLAADRETTLEDILKVADKQLPENVTQALVGEAFSRLEPIAQKLMQALAAYGRPVPEVAVDYLLQQYVTGVNSAPILGRLVNMHFVRREGGRFYLHPVDRQYALLLLPKGEDSDRFEFGIPLFTQVALFYKGAAYFGSIRKPREEWRTLEDLRPQLDEFDLRCEAGDWDTAITVLLEIDFNYLMLWGNYQLVVNLHTRLLGKINDVNLKAHSLNNLGHAFSYLGQIQNAISCYEEVHKIALDSENRSYEAVILGKLGNAYYQLGQEGTALDYYQQSLSIAREIGDKGTEGVSLNSLGNAYYESGKKEKAIDYYQQALSIAREARNKRDEGPILANLGATYNYLGQTEKAIDYYQQALSIAREIGHKYNEGSAVNRLGDFYKKLQQTEKAIDYYRQSLSIAREIGNKSNESVYLGDLGIAYSSLGQTEKAIDYYQQALSIAREINNRPSEAISLANLGLEYGRLGKKKDETEHFDQALSISIEIGNRIIEAFLLRNIAATHRSLGEIEKANNFLEQALAILTEVEDQELKSTIHRGIGQALSDQKKWDEAIQSFQQALDIANRINDQHTQNTSQYGLALIHLYNLDLKTAHKAAEAACQYNVTLNNYNVYTLLGVITLRQGGVGAAQTIFSEAITKGDAILAQTAQYYDALDAKGIARCGLALCTDDAAYIEQAKEAFRAARAITKAKGIVGQVVRLFDALSVADTNGMLRDVRAVAAGEE